MAVAPRCSSRRNWVSVKAHPLQKGDFFISPGVPQLIWEQGGLSSPSSEAGHARGLRSGCLAAGGSRGLTAAGAGELPPLPTRCPPAAAQAPQRRLTAAAAPGTQLHYLLRFVLMTISFPRCGPTRVCVCWNSLWLAGWARRRGLCTPRSTAGIVALWSGAAGLRTSDKISERLCNRNSKRAESK